jgi:6-phosphogluconolactonase (cycloisomerase 2 family)
MLRGRVWITGIILVGLAGCAAIGDFASDDPGFTELAGSFEGRFLAVSDADMAATAYADGKLEPFDGASDNLTLFADGAPVASVTAPNSVISWPQIVDVNGDGRRAYVIETFGSLPSGSSETKQVKDVNTAFPEGRTLRVFSLAADSLREIARRDDIGAKPQSVQVSADGRFLVIAAESEGAELTVVPLDTDGLPDAPRFIALDPPYQESDAEPRIRTLHLSPDNRTLAVNVSNARIQFYNLVPDADGLPERADPIGKPLNVGVRLAVGRWTPDGRFFLITDVNSYESSFAMLTQRGGQVHVIAPPVNGRAGRLIDSARVGRFAEGLELSDDGKMIASIAMERTYLPEISVLEVWPRRRTYLLTLLSLDPDTGELTELDRIRAAGVLPEDVIFDETGRNLAVAVFHRRKGPDRQRGFIDFFSISPDGNLRAQGRTQAVMRGPHDLVRIPE